MHPTNEPTPDLPALPLIVDAGLLRRIVEVLRPTSQPLLCWWCKTPLTGPTCPRCDAESLS